MPPKASKRKAANGYKLPEPIPNGTIITGTNKKQFRIGKSIGTGGFGEIYLASEDTSRPVGDDAVLALKIEPHENGPLFVEMNFYIRAAQSAMVEEFKKERNMKSFGMPCLRGNGSHVHNKEKYRFLIMDRYGKDLQKIFQTGKKCFSNRVTYNLALKIIDVLEYIHSKGYVHNDIKAQNLLLGYGRTKENDIYLVDFGLVSKYHKDGVHHEYKPDLRKAHDGTIEYTSRDAHIGAHSRRSDLEILAYNLVHWMSGDLPWMDNLANAKYVQSQKNGYMNDVKAFLQRCFKSDDYPDVLEEFLNYVVAMDFDTEPDYDKCRAMFQKALKKAKFPLDGKIDFATPKNAPKKVRNRSTPKRKAAADSSISEVEDSFEEVQVTTPAAKKTKKSPLKKVSKVVAMKDAGCQTSPAFVKAAKAARAAKTKSKLATAENPEMDQFAKKAVKAASKAILDENESSLSNPTPAMLALMAKKAEKKTPVRRSGRKWIRLLLFLSLL